MKHINIPVFVPHYGCTNDCVFCNQRKITNFAGNMDKNVAEHIISENLKTIDKQNTYVEVAFFGGSFTAVDRNLQFELLQTANKHMKSGDINGIRLSTRPDCINDEILSYLKEFGVTTIELGVQSLCDDVLEKSKRGHSAYCVYKSSKLIKQYGFNLGLQMMTGLPGDTYDKSIYTANEIARIRPDCVRIYPTLVFENTELYQMLKAGTYKAWDLDETVDLCAKLLDIFHKNNIKVIRLGLLQNENLNTKNGLAGGPVHPSIKELAESRLYYYKLKGEISKIENNTITLTVNNRIASKVIGNKRRNILTLEKELNKKITVKTTTENIDFEIQ